jgi:spore coat polysaccharide biosynthesis protein SpsF
LKDLYPEINLSAIEINQEAVDRLLEIDDLIVHQGSVLDIHTKKLYDLVFSVGVLIHINPNDLENVYQNIYCLSSRYILIAEYYSPKPTSVAYRGYENKLFKRDFAGELLDKYVDLKLIDYGFCYHRDPKVPLDDINWFLLEKV